MRMKCAKMTGKNKECGGVEFSIKSIYDGKVRKDIKVVQHRKEVSLEVCSFHLRLKTTDVDKDWVRGP